MSRLRLLPDGSIVDATDTVLVRLEAVVDTELSGRLLAAAQRWHDLASGNYYRPSGDCMCPICGRYYRAHPTAEEYDNTGLPWLHVLCNGDLVHL